MRKFMILAYVVFGLTLSLFGQDKDAIKERIVNAKNDVKSRIEIIKSAKDEAHEIRDAVKSGQITKDEGKSRLSELKASVRSAKDDIKSNSAIIRESRKELRELKREKRP